MHGDDDETGTLCPSARGGPDGKAGRLHLHVQYLRVLRTRQTYLSNRSALRSAGATQVAHAAHRVERERARLHDVGQEHRSSPLRRDGPGLSL